MSAVAMAVQQSQSVHWMAGKKVPRYGIVYVARVVIFELHKCCERSMSNISGLEAYVLQIHWLKEVSDGDGPDISGLHWSQHPRAVPIETWDVFFLRRRDTRFGGASRSNSSEVFAGIVDDDDAEVSRPFHGRITRPAGMGPHFSSISAATALQQNSPFGSVDFSFLYVLLEAHYSFRWPYVYFAARNCLARLPSYYKRVVRFFSCRSESPRCANTPCTHGARLTTIRNCIALQLSRPLLGRGAGQSLPWVPVDPS